MTRPRARRRGNARSNSASSSSPTQDISTALVQLQERLPDATWIGSVAEAERATADLLRPVFTTLSTENDPNVHICIANFFHSLAPSLETLPLLCNLAEKTASSPHPRDGTALSVSLRAILYLGQNSPRDEFTRDAYSRALPTLMPVLQTAIFKPRQSMLSSSSTTDDASGKVISVKTSLLSVRPHALRVLVYLAEMVSRPMAQYWIQLLPSRPGVPNTKSTRDNLATILLYDSQTEVRSLSVTAITALITSSKTFIRNSFIVSKQSSAAFTPSSSRILNCCRSLFSVMSSCIPKESNGVIVAKLARLTAQLFSAMPTSAMIGLSVQTLLKSLLQRALDQTGTDLTARVACASALANALSCSVVILESDFLTWISEQIAESLHPNQPVAELLVAFRSVVHERYELFASGWYIIKEHLRDMSATSEVALHTVRVFSAFLTSCLQGQQSNTKEDDVSSYIPLAIDVYYNLVKRSIEANDRVLRSSSIAAVQLLLQFHAAAVTSASSNGYNKDIDALAKDAVDLLKHLISLRDAQVLAVCIRTISYAHLDLEPNFAEDTLRMICHVMEHSAANCGTQVTKFCMSSMTRIMESLTTQFPYLLTNDILCITTRGNNFAVDALRNLHNLKATSSIKSSSDRASEESNKTAAVGLIASHISVQKSIDEKNCSVKEFMVEMSTEVQILRQLLLNNEETLNLRCCTCRALARVATLHASSFGQNVDGILLDIVASMSPMNNIRLQICSASSLTQILKSLKAEGFRFAILQNCINCFLAVTSEMKKGGLTSKLRIQLNTLLTLIGELIFAVFLRASTELFTEVKSKWENEWESNILIACVSSYLSLPKYVKYEWECDSDRLIESTPVAQRDVMCSILQLTKSLNRSVEQDVSEQGESHHLSRVKR